LSWVVGGGVWIPMMMTRRITTPPMRHKRIFISFHHICFRTRFAPRRNPCAETARLSTPQSASSVHQSRTNPRRTVRGKKRSKRSRGVRFCTCFRFKGIQSLTPLSDLVNILPHNPDLHVSLEPVWVRHSIIDLGLDGGCFGI
jgi:hypothetical protein